MGSMRSVPEYRPLPNDMFWEGAVNARWITGAFYRMGRHEWLTDLGWQQMRGDGIARVIDLRNPGEIKRREHDPVLDHEGVEGVQVLELPLETSDNERFASVAVPYMNHTNMYRLVCEEFGDQLRAVFEALSETAEHGTVIHCSAGRDRSGLIATLLLDLAGRREDIVAHDELAVRGINEWHRVSPRKHPYESYQNEPELRRNIAERAQGLQEFLQWLGSARDFLSSCGMQSEDLDQLQNLVRQPKP
ncbi:hypothetical protein CIK74_14975 [Glutamicibacter sp. BW77]|nr:hypothetical protein CIK74_14975 [Glutamicibacter sp. BW77]HBV11333.1 protein-tyrosine-phosphatase [Micrococcaceae bacterium]